jgi:two-component system LytT family response regulator
MRIRTIIVDDNKGILDKISRLLKPDPDIDLTGQYSDRESALAAILKEPPDLIFFDVDLGSGLDAFEILHQLPEDSMPEVVFMTGLKGDALNAAALQSLSSPYIEWLPKPFDRDGFYRALHLAKRRIYDVDEAAIFRAMIRGKELRNQGEYSEYLFLDDRDKHGKAIKIQVKTSEIEYVKADGKYCYLFVLQTDGGLEKRFFPKPLAWIHDQLDKNQFIMTHKSYIVNRARIESLIEVKTHWYRARLFSGAEVGLSRETYRKLLRNESHR